MRAFEDEFEEPAPDALTGHADLSEERPVEDLLLKLIAATVQLRVLLSEADEAEFRRITPRLRVLVGLVANFPTECERQHRPMGFKLPLPKKKGKK